MSLQRRVDGDSAATVTLDQLQGLVEELEATRDRLEEAQRVARLGSWEWNIPENKVSWSDELFRIYGLEPGETEPSYEEFLSRVHPDDRDAVDARNRKAFTDHQPFEDIKRCLRPDGSEFLMHTQGEVITDGENNPVRMVGICEDVTVERRAAAAQAQLAAIVHSSDDAIVSKTPEGVVADWNPGAERLYGYSRGEMVGKNIALLIPPARRTEESAKLARASLGERIPTYETRRLCKDGTAIDVSVTLSAVRDPEGEVLGVASIARDITERRQFEAELTYLANHDALTGLFNRRRFEEELASRVALSHRYGGGGGVLLLDLDNFKYVNDAHGHRAGDELLRGVADLLNRTLRLTDMVARLGGDEFAVLIPESDSVRAQQLAQRLLERMRDQVTQIEGRPVKITASIGVVTFSDADRDGVEVLDAVDQAMYRAKGDGRDRAVMQAEARERVLNQAPVGWEHRIREALDNDMFELYSQPILDVQTGQVSQHELLLRMRGEEGLILPGAFLGVAERFGLIHAIDRWVVTQAVEILARTPDVRLEINVSARSVGDKQLMNLIGLELAEKQVDPTRLILEITETAAIASIDEARRFALALSDLGCRFALDDFGAGFGSFYYMKHMPVDYLKIDGDFIRSPRSATDDLVIESIVRIARGLGKRTVAEFVEDEATLQAVREHGVDFAQGYHIGRPVPVSTILNGSAVEGAASAA